ncbi:Ig-like domain-containing protein, partial [Methanobrevibacter sp.]|uniref:Ig-like domain-containing protein n=1 Tax=Methanobrevibacter sp. TaxID=66852 RepID=UPI00388ED30C
VSGLKDATGNVSAKVGNGVYIAPIIDGVATITVPGLVENATADISYDGDDKYNPAKTSVDIVVNPKEKENATIRIDAPEVTEGENLTITATLPKDATGNLTATVGDKTYTVPVENGTATLTIPDLAAGNYTIPVTYSGDDKYNPVTKDVNVTVDEDKSDIIEAPDVTKYYKGPERFVVKVTDYKGKGIANKNVKININGVDYDRTTNTNGTTSLALNLGSGVYNVTTTVDNTTIDSVVTILTTVNGTDVVKVFRNDTQYYATFRDSMGNYLAQGSQVEFNINGVFYYRYTGDKGLAKLNLNLEQGTYILTARNLQTGEMSSNNITVLPRIVENNDLTKYYRNASQYTVKIIGDDGKAVGAGVEVTFNINGVFYTRSTNASGIAKLNINLEPGKYIITASHANCSVANNITVLPVLTAENLTKKYGTPDQFVATLVDGQGNPYAGQNVTFNVHGVFYQRTTDSEGHAKLNIRLMPGEYIITSSYNGSNIANTIKVEA